MVFKVGMPVPSITTASMECPRSVASAPLQTKVKPNARMSLREHAADGSWRAQLKLQPVDGKANEELIAPVARQFGCRKSAVSIRSGASGRMKLVIEER